MVLKNFVEHKLLQRLYVPLLRALHVSQLPMLSYEPSGGSRVRERCSIQRFITGEGINILLI
jgi:hypothetical protein